MSEDTPGIPRNPPPPQPPDGHSAGGREQEPRRGSMGLGILLGTLALYVFYVGAMINAGGPFAPIPPALRGWGALIPLGIYLLLSILLTVWARTSRLGTGLLIGLGLFLLLGGGLCVGSLAETGRLA